jgi:hypothetical protein
VFNLSEQLLQCRLLHLLCLQFSRRRDFNLDFENHCVGAGLLHFAEVSDCASKSGEASSDRLLQDNDFSHIGYGHPRIDQFSMGVVDQQSAQHLGRVR